MKPMKKLTVLSMIFAGLSSVYLYAAGYRIPEQTSHAVALGAAYVAGANGADAVYYNPANLSWQDDASELETSFTYINLPKVTYTDSNRAAFNGKSEEENFFLPTVHYLSPSCGNWRYGLSFVVPAGLSKRWYEGYGRAFCQEFTLKTYETNPVGSYKFNDQLSLGFGLRAIYSKGEVKSNASGIGLNAVRRVDGDSLDYGYNLALSYKPLKDLNLSLTYRSKVNLTLEGDGKLIHPLIPGGYEGDAAVDVIVPAVLSLAVAYTFNEKTTLEFVYERNYWSSYEDLDFEYDASLRAFDAPIEKDWKDSNAWRIGLTHIFSEKIKGMIGFSIDETPVPDSTLGFELPDSDAKSCSVGMEYQHSEALKLLCGILYNEKEERTVAQTNGINGTFSDAKAFLYTVSARYRF